MKNISGIAQLILRLALGLGFVLPVMDRLGLNGPYGTDGVSWGDWSHFIDYTHTIIPFANRPITNVMGFLTTIAEGTFGICLIIGFRVKEAALGTGLLTVSLGVLMAIFLGLNAPFAYPVFVFTGGALLLSTNDRFKWSVDDYIKSKSSN